MDAPLQYSEVDTTSEERLLESSEAKAVVLLPPATESEASYKWQRINQQIKDFLAKLPDYLGSFFKQNQRPITNIGLILAAIVALRLIIGILDALNDIPLLGSTFEFIGICYSVWFVYRYLLKVENRQEIARQWENLKEQVVG
jgi:CAAD domains of cyanobacterial aminoacyl-tRNA synthetase